MAKRLNRSNQSDFSRGALVNLFVLSLFFAPAFQSLAEKHSEGLSPNGKIEYFSVGILSDKITSQWVDVLPDSTQEASQWCWAASISMGFAYYGYSVPQQEIVSRIKQIPVNLPGRGDEITKALSLTWTDSSGKRFKSKCVVFDPSGNKWALTTKRMLKELENEKVVVHGASGHATLLTAVVYSEDENGSIIPLKGIVRDPSPLYKGARRELYPNEFASIYAAVISVEPVNNDDKLQSAAPPPGTEDTFEGVLKRLWGEATSDFSSCKGQLLEDSGGDPAYECKIRFPGALSTQIKSSDKEWACDIKFGPFSSFGKAQAEALIIKEKAIAALNLSKTSFTRFNTNDGRWRTQSDSGGIDKQGRHLSIMITEMNPKDPNIIVKISNTHL